MKKNNILKGVLPVLLAGLLLVGCSGKEPYSLKTVDGVHYIEVGSEYAPSEEDLKINVAAPSLEFSTMDEMVDTVLNKKLDEKQLKTVYRFEKDKSGKIRTVDFNNLAVPVLPNNHTLSPEVTWTGRDYYFETSVENGSTIWAYCETADLFEGLMSREYGFIYENDNATITKEETVEDRNATVVHTQTSSAELRRIIYSFQEGDTQYTIFEKYTLRSNDPSVITSEDIPRYVMVFVRNKDFYVRFQIRDLTERPSMEYLKQFNVTKYVPAEEKK